jgi:hypothetical protein
MVAKGKFQSIAKGLAKLLEAFLSAGEGSVVADSNKGRIARVIAVANHPIRVTRFADELVEEVVLRERISPPNEVPVKPDEQAQERIGNDVQLRTTSRLFQGACEVDIAENEDSQAAVHNS